MTKTKYLHVHDWRVHQSYRADRGMPPWIKIQRSLLRNPKWVALSDSERGQLISIWMLAADNDGKIHNDAEIIRKACGLETEIDLNRFISLGLFDAKMTSRRRQVDAKMTPTWRQDDAPEAEAEAEAETEEETSSLNQTPSLVAASDGLIDDSNSGVDLFEKTAEHDPEAPASDRPDGLSHATIDEAKRKAPDFDVEHIAAEWAKWNESRGIEPAAPNAAFLGFVQAFIERNPLNAQAKALGIDKPRTRRTNERTNKTNGTDYVPRQIRKGSTEFAEFIAWKKERGQRTEFSEKQEFIYSKPEWEAELKRRQTAEAPQ